VNDQDVVERQLRFFVEKRAGCLFAAVAARDPRKYGWVHRLTAVDSAAIDTTLDEAIQNPETTTLSLLFPAVSDVHRLLELVACLERCKGIVLEQTEDYEGSTCLGFRALVGLVRSYVTGFGNFDFLPATRRAPFVELTTRVKPRPNYEYVFKPAPEGVIHLADLDMKGIPFESLQALWEGSFTQTKQMLGDVPDLRSAARTTFSIPSHLLTKNT
jgi:hypothetical protein